MIEIEINNDHEFPIGDLARLKKAILGIYHEARVKHGEISLAFVTDDEMHALNKQYLEHDYTTDVLSFVLEQDDKLLDGELIVCYPYAEREAVQFHWTPADEVLLYTIHGALHLVGYDDLTPDAKAEMRSAERRHLANFGLTPVYAEE